MQIRCDLFWRLFCIKGEGSEDLDFFPPGESVSIPFFPIVGLDSDPGSEEISSGAWGHRLGDFSNFVVHSSAFV